MRKLALLSVLVLLFSGCFSFRGLKENIIVKHPNAPMLIIETSSNAVRVAIYDKEENKLIEYGWIDAATLVGRTAVTYDWQTFIAKRDDE